MRKIVGGSKCEKNVKNVKSDSEILKSGREVVRNKKCEKEGKVWGPTVPNLTLHVCHGLLLGLVGPGMGHVVHAP